MAQQVGDSTLVSREPKKELDPEERLARRAALRSALLPGWGQGANGGLHWIKVPFIYLGIGGLAYTTHLYHGKFKCFESSYLLASKGELTTGCNGYTTVSTLKGGMERYHQQRDLFAILTVGLYALNILDAYIWAHMKQFDDSDDLSYHLSPGILRVGQQSFAGLAVQLRF
jgi:hypothetical protein